MILPLYPTLHDQYTAYSYLLTKNPKEPLKSQLQLHLHNIERAVDSMGFDYKTPAMSQGDLNETL